MPDLKHFEPLHKLKERPRLFEQGKQIFNLQKAKLASHKQISFQEEVEVISHIITSSYLKNKWKGLEEKLYDDWKKNLKLYERDKNVFYFVLLVFFVFNSPTATLPVNTLN